MKDRKEQGAAGSRGRQRKGRGAQDTPMPGRRPRVHQSPEVSWDFCHPWQLEVPTALLLLSNVSIFPGSTLTRGVTSIKHPPCVEPSSSPWPIRFSVLQTQWPEHPRRWVRMRAGRPTCSSALCQTSGRTKAPWWHLRIHASESRQRSGFWMRDSGSRDIGERTLWQCGLSTSPLHLPKLQRPIYMGIFVNWPDIPCILD